MMTDISEPRFSPRQFRGIASRCALLSLILLIAGCSTQRETEPSKTATEQLIISRAVDDAIEKIRLPDVAGKSVFLDIAGIQGEYASYAAASLREAFLVAGGRIAADRASADIVLDARAGALSMDNFSTLIGLPSYEVPIPLAGDLVTPEAALYKRAERRGIMKLALVSYDAKTGEYIDATGPSFGFAQERKWTVLFFFDWENEDLIPDGIAPSRNDIDGPG